MDPDANQRRRHSRTSPVRPPELPFSGPKRRLYASMRAENVAGGPRVPRGAGPYSALAFFSVILGSVAVLAALVALLVWITS